MKDVVRADWDPPGEEWPLLFRHFEEVRGKDFKVEDFMQTTDGVAVASWKNALDRVRSGQEDGAPDLRKYDASDWSDFAVVEDAREKQDHKPLMAIPAPPEASLLAA
jgi:hypothetical protein